MKRIIIYFILILVFPLFAENINSKVADDLYNSDSYLNAKEEYKKLLINNTINAQIAYRFAYSSENIFGLNKQVLEYYSLSKYLFEKENNVDNKYYLSVKTKLENNEPNLITINQEKAQEIIKSIQNSKNKVIKTHEGNFGIYLIFFILFIIIVLVCRRIEIGLIWGPVIIIGLSIICAFLQTSSILDKITYCGLDIILLFIIFSGGYKHARKDGKADRRFSDNPYLYVFSDETRKIAKRTIIFPLVLGFVSLMV